jgi:hypothetical protein
MSRDTGPVYKRPASNRPLTDVAADVGGICASELSVPSDFQGETGNPPSGNDACVRVDVASLRKTYPRASFCTQCNFVFAFGAGHKSTQLHDVREATDAELIAYHARRTAKNQGRSVNPADAKGYKFDFGNHYSPVGD